MLWRYVHQIFYSPLEGLNLFVSYVTLSSDFRSQKNKQVISDIGTFISFRDEKPKGNKIRPFVPLRLMYQETLEV